MTTTTIDGPSHCHELQVFESPMFILMDMSNLVAAADVSTQQQPL